MRKRIKIICLLTAAVLASALSACSADEGEAKVRDLEFTVVEEKEIPRELAKLIEEKKLNEFRLTYTDDSSLYLVMGYGEQETGGYSISVNACYLTETSLVFDTTLMGPSKEEIVQQKPSYPYIVVKTEKREEPVIFQ